MNMIVAVLIITNQLIRIVLHDKRVITVIRLMLQIVQTHYDVLEDPVLVLVGGKFSLILEELFVSFLSLLPYIG